MLRTNTLMAMLLLLATNSWGQNGKLHANADSPAGLSKPNELPITITWDENGINVRANGVGPYSSNNFFQTKPSKYLEKVGNDLIRINLGGDDIPVLIDLTNYFDVINRDNTEFTSINENEPSLISIDHPDLAVKTALIDDSFVLVLENYNKRSRKEIIFKGMDVFLVEADKSASLYSNSNKIYVDVKRSQVNKLVVRGALLDITGFDTKIPELCKKYNEKFGEQAFVCFEEETEEPEIWDSEHVRDLVTKYNITDFDDKPIAYLDFVLITKKGIGFNLKKEDYNTKKEIVYKPYDSYEFFSWQEFLNLNFNKYIDNIRILVNDPYSKSFIHYSKTNFTNVELVQFLKELRFLVSKQMQ